MYRSQKLYGVCTLWEKGYMYSILILIMFNVQIPKLYRVFSLWERRWIYWMHNIFSELITILKLTIGETKRDTLCPQWHDKEVKMKLWVSCQAITSFTILQPMIFNHQVGKDEEKTIIFLYFSWLWSYSSLSYYSWSSKNSNTIRWVYEKKIRLGPKRKITKEFHIHE